MGSGSISSSPSCSPRFLERTSPSSGEPARNGVSVLLVGRSGYPLDLLFFAPPLKREALTSGDTRCRLSTRLRPWNPGPVAACLKPASPDRRRRALTQGHRESYQDAGRLRGPHRCLVLPFRPAFAPQQGASLLTLALAGSPNARDAVVGSLARPAAAQAPTICIGRARARVRALMRRLAVFSSRSGSLLRCPNGDLATTSKTSEADSNGLAVDDPDLLLDIAMLFAGTAA